MSDYIWVIGGGLMQLPLIDECKKMGYKTIVSDASYKCVCQPKADMFFEIDIFDVGGHIKAALTMKDSIKAVVAAGIDAPVTQAATAEVLGLPGVGGNNARLLHNKAWMRSLFRFWGIQPMKYWHVTKECPITESPAIDLVVKPTSNSGSRGVSIVRKGAPILKLYKAIETAKENSKGNDCVIEERFLGSEHTVETLFNNGEFVPCFITDRYFVYSNGNAVETGLRNPTMLPKYAQRAAYTLAEHIGKMLEIQYGAVKLDIMVTDDGVKILEATTRLSGGFDSQYLVPAATGKNILKAYIQTCLGQNISHDCLAATKEKVAASSSIWPAPGAIKSISGISAANKVPGIEKIIMRKDVGDVVTSYESCADRAGFIVASGATEDEAIRAIEDAKAKIKVVTA